MRIDHIILFVDDDPDDLEMLRCILEENRDSYRIETAENGEEALKKLERLRQAKQSPCLIVLDMNMPRLDGKETLKKIRANDQYKYIPIIIFSTASRENVDDFYSEHGAEYLSKPMDYKMLYQLVDQFTSTCNHAVQSS